MAYMAWGYAELMEQEMQTNSGIAFRDTIPTLEK